MGNNMLVQVPQHVLNSVLGEGATEEKGENARLVRYSPFKIHRCRNEH